MIKVFQEVFDPGKGDCMRAVTASLFELPLKDVPNFIELGDQWFIQMRDFYKERGYEWLVLGIGYHSETGVILNDFYTSYDMIKEALHYDNGINGYFFASVPSQTYPYPCTHAVVIDANMKIVHDPSPKGKCLLLTEKDIFSIMTNKKGWYFDVDNKFCTE